MKKVFFNVLIVATCCLFIFSGGSHDTKSETKTDCPYNLNDQQWNNLEDSEAEGNDLQV